VVVPALAPRSARCGLAAAAFVAVRVDHLVCDDADIDAPAGAACYVSVEPCFASGLLLLLLLLLPPHGWWCCRRLR
jgi:hypothetical protein